MRKIVILAAALAMPLAATPAAADGHEEAKPELANKDWYNVVSMRFHAGKQADAMELIKMFIATDKALGLEPPIMLNMSTGEYDVMVMFKMREGIASMGWKNSPSGKKWNAKFTELVGGEEKAKEHWEKFGKVVAASSSDIGSYDIDYHKGA